MLCVLGFTSRHKCKFGGCLDSRCSVGKNVIFCLQVQGSFCFESLAFQHLMCFVLCFVFSFIGFLCVVKSSTMDFISDWRGSVASIVSWSVDNKSGVVTTSSDLPKATKQPFSTVSLLAASVEHKKNKEVGICRFFFENGRCLKGENCPYSHSLAALVKSGGISRTRPSAAPSQQHVCDDDDDNCDDDDDGCTTPEQPVWFFPDAPFIFQQPPPSPCFVPPQVPVPFVFAPVPSADGEPTMFSPMPLISPFVLPCAASESPRENEEGESEESGSENDEKHDENPQRQRRVCSFFYHNGHCQRGSSCHFLHEWAPGMEVPPLPKDVMRERGCHGQSASVPIPSEKKACSQSSAQQSAAPHCHSLTGQILESASHKFLDPVCGETTAAFFPRRRSTRPPREHHSPSFLASGLFRSKPCMFFFETGFCLKGDRCNFSHDPRVLMDQVNHGTFVPGRSGP